MKHLFIVNPTAGGKDHTPDVQAAVDSVFSSSDADVEVYVTTAPLDACRKIEEEAALSDDLRVYSCGGDGTFNECVTGAALKKNVSVTPYPTGTGNDFCRMFGEEKDMFKDLSALVAGSIRPIDVIACNDRYSVNLCSVGVDARIGVNVHKYSKIPLIGGATGYVVSAIVEVFKGIAMPMKITCGDFSIEGEQTLVVACNGRYYGGGFNPWPEARPDDGLLDILIVKKVSLLQLARLIGKYAAGKAKDLTEYIRHIQSDRITIAFEEDNVVNLDGEAMFTKKAEMQLIPGGVNLIVPSGMRFFAENL